MGNPTFDRLARSGTSKRGKVGELEQIERWKLRSKQKIIATIVIITISTNMQRLQIKM